jgi:phage terminase small subunit
MPATVTQLSRRKNDTQRVPKRLKKAGREYWNSTVTEWELDEHLLPLLHALCLQIDILNEAEIGWVKLGRPLTCEDRHGQLKPHPLVAVIEHASIQIARLKRELNVDVNDPGDSRPPKLKYPR